MKKLKKLFAVMLSLIMVLAMGITSFAATTPTATDTATATVQNVEKTATVTAYKITKANYDGGFTGYSAVKGVTLANVLAPTPDEVTTIAKNTTLLATLDRVTMTAGAPDANGLASFTANLTAGYWVVIVNGTVKEVYNPMLLGVYYKESGSSNVMESKPLDANSNWVLDGQTVYAKSTEPYINKEVVDGDGINNKQNDVAVGDTVSYKITTAIPSYSDQYDTVKVKITDTLSTGLTLNASSIKINGKSASESEVKGTLDTKEHGFEFTVNNEYALANGGKEITIEYTATVNDNATVNFDPNTNTAELEYTNDPSGSTKTTESETYTYTFSIGAALSQSITNFNQKVNQIVKVDADGKIITTKKELTETEKEKYIQVGKGATFTLTSMTNGNVYTATTGEDGALTFVGLDAGTYTLVETVAPDGFTLDTTAHTVVISPKYGETSNKLEKLEITIDGKATSTYEVSYEATGTVTVKTNTTAVTNIKNTKISSLPSTGGIGTTIFTIVGCGIMIAAAVLFFASRRKENR